MLYVKFTQPSEFITRQIKISLKMKENKKQTN